jgi:hypothetical protein
MHMQNNLTDLTSPSTIENADFAFYDWMDLDLNLFCTQQDGLKKVPILWVSPERAYQIKSDREFRDTTGAINPPVISVERISIAKDVKDNGTYYANIPPLNNRHRVSRKINQKKTSEFANADAAKSNLPITFLGRKKQNKKIVYEYSDMLLPVYAMFSYKISILTQYQQQMNELLQPFLTRTGSTKYFLIERDGYKYESFIDGQISSRNATGDMATEERKYISEITIKVLVNLLSDGVNEKTKVIKTYENPVELKLNKDKISIINPSRPSQVNILSPLSNGGPQMGGSKTLINKEIGLVVGPSNTSNGTTNVFHGLNNQNIQVAVREADTLINIISNIYYYDNYIEVDGLEDGIEYLFTITG